MKAFISFTELILIINGWRAFPPIFLTALKLVFYDEIFTTLFKRLSGI